MKSNLKEKNGITLVALIITIIVLLILAVVTISAVNEGSLFAHANNAATMYKDAAERENSLLYNLIGNIKPQGHISSQGIILGTYLVGQYNLDFGMTQSDYAKITVNTEETQVRVQIYTTYDVAESSINWHAANLIADVTYALENSATGQEVIGGEQKENVLKVAKDDEENIVALLTANEIYMLSYDDATDTYTVGTINRANNTNIDFDNYSTNSFLVAIKSATDDACDWIVENSGHGGERTGTIAANSTGYIVISEQEIDTDWGSSGYITDISFDCTPNSGVCYHNLGDNDSRRMGIWQWRYCKNK